MVSSDAFDVTLRRLRALMMLINCTTELTSTSDKYWIVPPTTQADTLKTSDEVVSHVKYCVWKKIFGSELNKTDGTLAELKYELSLNGL